MPSEHGNPPKNLKNKSFVAYDVTPKDLSKLIAYLCFNKKKKSL